MTRGPAARGRTPLPKLRNPYTLWTMAPPLAALLVAAFVAAVPAGPSELHAAVLPNAPVLRAIPADDLGEMAPGALPPPPSTVVRDTRYYGTVTIDHRAHLARRASCRSCHGTGVVSKLVFTPKVAHERCIGCHEEKSAGPTQCQGCHVQINGIGFGFENYDSAGAYRTRDNTLPVVASGELVGTDVDGPFDGAIELSQKLAQSQQVSDCAAANWVRYALGRRAVDEDACLLERARASLVDSRGDVRELLIAIVTSPDFARGVP